MEIKVIVAPGQSLFDISIQRWGDVSGVFEIAKANNISITETLIPGTSLIVPLPKSRPQIVTWFEKEAIEIAASGSPIPEPPEGLGNEYLEYPEPALTLE